MNLLNMKIIKINSLTLYFLLLSFLCGYLKTALIIFLIVLIHELGHVFFTKLFSYEIKSITIYPFGGITKIKKDINVPLKNDFLIAIGGVLFQLIIFLSLFLPISELTKQIIIKYNISIMIFNLLPIIPLDGSIIINLFLNKFFSFSTAFKIYNILSGITIIWYIFFNYWQALNNYLIVFLFIYKTYENWKNYHYLYNRFLLERYLNNYKFSHICTKKGDLSILKRDTYQYFLEKQGIISEKKKLKQRFDNKVLF